MRVTTISFAQKKTSPKRNPWNPIHSSLGWVEVVSGWCNQLCIAVRCRGVTRLHQLKSFPGQVKTSHPRWAKNPNHREFPHVRGEEVTKTAGQIAPDISLHLLRYFNVQDGKLPEITRCNTRISPVVSIGILPPVTFQRGCKVESKSTCALLYILDVQV